MKKSYLTQTMKKNFIEKLLEAHTDIGFLSYQKLAENMHAIDSSADGGKDYLSLIKGWFTGRSVPNPVDCKTLEKVLQLDEGTLAAELGYVTNYSTDTCRVLREFFIQNKKNRNKSLVYIIVGAIDQKAYPDGITIDELIKNNKEIPLRIEKVTECLASLCEQGAVEKRLVGGEERYLAITSF